MKRETSNSAVSTNCAKRIPKINNVATGTVKGIFMINIAKALYVIVKDLLFFSSITENGF